MNECVDQAVPDSGPEVSRQLVESIRCEIMKLFKSWTIKYLVISSDHFYCDEVCGSWASFLYGLRTLRLCVGLRCSFHTSSNPPPPACRFNAWMHVDAAYAGSASICPEQRHFFTGLEHVDSYQFNPHKWMLTNFDCCACW